MSVVDHASIGAWDLSVEPPHRLLTVADLDSFPTELPSGPVDYELDNGRLVLIPPPGGTHGSIQVRVGGHLLYQGELKGHGRAFTETGIILWRDPDCVVSPDAASICAKSLPASESAQGYLRTMPELVVEVRSKDDSAALIRRKAEHYLKAGVEVVWVVDPTTRTIVIQRSQGAVETLGLGDVLQLPGIIPDFSLAVADIFRD
ncbi:MAG TPA: Uma2 family endonuclease [Lacipirellulaceae bacterium]|nr:Uma2 family endonuclease [Lacipirellulaceae bacterium]